MEREIPVKNMDDLNTPDRKFGFSILLCGSTRSGKTTMLNYLYNRHFKKHITSLMSNSLNSDAYDFVKRYCVLSDLYHPEMLKEMYQINHSTENNYEFCIILDDLTNVKNDKEYLRLLTIYRNSRISCIVSAQGISMFNKTARGNINFVLLGRLNSDAEVEKVIKEYLISYFPKNINMSEKVTLYRQLTDDHWFFVIDQVC
jgi:predicted AAA+ superfamily ATPase